MDYFFSKIIDYNGNNRFRGLNFTSVKDYNRLFLSRESIIIDYNPWALGAGSHFQKSNGQTISRVTGTKRAS